MGLVSSIVDVVSGQIASSDEGAMSRSASPAMTLGQFRLQRKLVHGPSRSTTRVTTIDCLSSRRIYRLAVAAMWLNSVVGT